MPDDVLFVDAIPLGATGKIHKKALREDYKDHKLPTAEPPSPIPIAGRHREPLMPISRFAAVRARLTP